MKIRIEQKWDILLGGKLLKTAKTCATSHDEKGFYIPTVIMNDIINSHPSIEVKTRFSAMEPDLQTYNKREYYVKSSTKNIPLRRIKKPGIIKIELFAANIEQRLIALTVKDFFKSEDPITGEITDLINFLNNMKINMPALIEQSIGKEIKALKKDTLKNIEGIIKIIEEHKKENKVKLFEIRTLDISLF